MLRLKQTVRVHKLTPQMSLAALIVSGVYGSFSIPECWITSANDSKHKDGSKHYSGDALDFRMHNVPLEKRPVIVDKIRDSLGDDFDVLWESAGTPNEHLHVEFDDR